MPLLAALDVYPSQTPETTRKLVLATNRPDWKIVVVRAADVPTYVEYGAADIGIVGRDVLLEEGNNGLYELLDLKIARCKMVLAGPEQGKENNTSFKVATKYVNITHNYFAAQGTQVNIIKLYGSMELAPSLGLASRIVDLMDTGHTLKANGLVPLEEIMPISARLIVNKAAMKVKNAVIRPIVTQLAAFVDDQCNLSA